MTTPFAAALSRLGLSQSEAAAALSVRRDTIASWCIGRRLIPDAVWPELAALARTRSADALRLAREIEARIKRAA